MAFSASSTAGVPISAQCTILSESRVENLGSDQTVRIKDYTPAA
jgi:hypothetical protein